MVGTASVPRWGATRRQLDVCHRTFFRGTISQRASPPERIPTEEREKKIELLIQQHGIKAFFAARFLVGLRSPFYLTAGILRVKYRWFLFADFICASIVISAFFGLAYAFGNRITGLIQSAEKGLTLVVLIAGIVAFAVATFLWFRKRRMQILDENPDSLLENRELIFGPAADRLSDSSGSASPLQPEQNREGKG